MKQKLMNRRLRQIIESIDDSKLPQQKLEALISNDPEFRQFVDYMLKLIGFRPNIENKNNKDDDDLSKYYDQDADLDAMNDNDKFKYLLRQMLHKYKD